MQIMYLKIIMLLIQSLISKLCLKRFYYFSANQTAFSKMEDLTTKVVQSTQTGSLSSATGLNLDVVTVTEPTPPPVDPTGGVRATLDTGKLSY